MAKFEVAMVPWLAIGHITPFIHIANELAGRGHRISILLPNNTALRLQHLILHPNLINIHTIILADIEGLPIGAETASDMPEDPMGHPLAVAIDLTRAQVEEHLSKTKPHFVFHDLVHWIPDITKQLGLISVCFHVISAASLTMPLVLQRIVPEITTLTQEDLSKLPNDFPASFINKLRGYDRYEFVHSLLHISRSPGVGIASFYDRIFISMKNCDVLSIRTCRELEDGFCDFIGNHYGKPLLLTGSVLPELVITPLEDRWANWLGGFEVDTVVFCAFGSQLVLEKDQFQELVLGFELTGLPFFIALKPPIGCQTIEEALPEGFEERVRGRGVVHGGWVQQPQILSHPSVGCFVNHCGFGSMWESLMSDKQVVLVPHLGDQVINTNLLVEELKVAVKVEREDKGWFTKESLSKAIKSVMNRDSEVGILVKKNHVRLKEVLGKPGFTSGYIDKFVLGLHEIVNQK
ncbi:UDP-glycosyltransferase 79B6 [Ziziphus jujuba]|uniref:UDP-glycosyltransferase 79B6 n=1 Tax=Ziziphus jujuba TaxID=326968 RepID=A0A6P4AMB0_ZIZJJ|nr:UDP-glycosyltransferase 79B6 [Ziziphus jujuba]